MTTCFFYIVGTERDPSTTLGMTGVLLRMMEVSFCMTGLLLGMTDWCAATREKSDRQTGDTPFPI